jgi:hypothetical protein
MDQMTPINGPEKQKAAHCEVAAFLMQRTRMHVEKPAARCTVVLDARCTIRTAALLERHCRRSRRFFKVP